MSYDTDVIRPEIRVESIKSRGEAGTAAERRATRSALRTLHTLEIMATKIYACQITSRPSPLNTALTAAMCNEMTHAQDFQTKLFEYGFTPRKWRGAHWMVGYILGLGSRLLGQRRILKTGIWAEAKAVHQYSELLSVVEWDDDTRAIIEKDQADEAGHIEKWRTLLEAMDAAR